MQDGFSKRGRKNCRSTLLHYSLHTHTYVKYKRVRMNRFSCASILFFLQLHLLPLAPASMVSWSSYLDGLISRGSFLPDYCYYEVDRGSLAEGEGSGRAEGARRNKKYITFSSSSDSLTGTEFTSLFKAMIVFSNLILVFGCSFIFIGLFPLPAFFFFFRLVEVLGNGE